MKLTIDTVAVESISQTVQELIEQYRAQYQKVYESATSMSTYWDGDAKKSYVEKVESFKQDFEKMVEVLKNYTTKLNAIAKRYNEAEVNAKKMADKLSGLK